MARQPARATVEDLLALPEERRLEIVRGTIVEKAAPSAEHGDAQAALTADLRGAFHGRGGDGRPGGWWILVEVDIEFETHEVYRPDVSGWRRDRVPERPSGRPVSTRPDWVCEVVSPSTAHVDLGPKQRTLHRCGVPHYWIVDPTTEVLTVYRWEQPGYVLALTAHRGERVRAEPFDAIELDVGVLFGDERQPAL